MLSVLVASLWLTPTGPVSAQEAPRTLLYLPLDGSADATIAADGYGKASYAALRYHPGKRGQAAEIGSDLYPCSLMMPARLNLDKVRGSLELWYRPDHDAGDGAHKVLAADEHSGNESGRICLYTGGGGIGFDLQTTESLHVGAAVGAWKAGDWHHVLVTWDDGAGLRLFLDGDLANERKATWKPEDAAPSRRLHLGGDWNGKYLAQGWLDEVRVYDRALSPEEAHRAFEGTLTSPPAERRTATPLTAPAAPHRKPKLLFYAPLDGTATATVAGGKAEPLAATNVKFAPGLLGQALVADEGIVLSYDARQNLNKVSGAISLWVAPTKQGLDDNCAYFADEFDTWQQPAKNVNALWLWLWRGAPGQPTLRFDMRPPITQAGVRNWEPNTWHHLVGCWQNGEEISLYLDGQLAVKQGGQKATYDGALWDPTDPSVFYLGSYNGRMPARALIDEVKVYDGPLSAQEVAEEAGRLILPLTVDLGRTLFERGLAAPLPIRFYNASSKPVEGRFQVHLLDPSEKEVATAPIAVKAPPTGWGEGAISLPPAAVAQEGVYQVRLLQEGQVATRLSSYYLVVPPIPEQKPSDGVLDPHPKLTLVDDIDCTTDPGPDRFASTGHSKVVTSDIGTYREAGPQAGDRIAYRFKVRKPGVWHVAVVIYPDDKPRACDIIMNSPKFVGNTYDVATGYFCGDECRLTNELVELPIYFTPREEDGAFELMTLEANRPAAVASIGIFEVEGGLPVAAMKVPPDGGRRIGNYWEDPTICLEHGGLNFTAPEVYQSFSRLVDYLRFSGQNLICYPIAWYTGTMYPSPREGFRLGAGSDRHTTDWVEYALRLCERRGVRFLPEMYFAGTLKMADEYRPQTEDQVWAGEPTPKLAMWDGTITQGVFYFNPPLYNVLHPVTRQALTAYLEEAADRYAKYPALEGLSLLVGQGNCVWFGSIQSGYDDYTVGLFEQETGIKVPADRTGPARFSQRFRWLVEHQYDRWVAWRCEKVRDLYVDLARRLQSRRPDLKLYLTFYSVDGNNVNPMFNLGTWQPRGRSTDRIYREGGFDTRLYRDLPGIVLRRVTYPIDYRFFKAYGGGAEPVAHPVLARDIELLSEGIGPFKQSCLPATAFHCRYYESDIGKSRPIPGFWWECHPWRVSQPTASGRNFLEFYAHAVAELDSVSLAYGGYTVTSKGHEDDLQDFARYYRALPRVRFADVPGMSDPVCVREWRGEGRHYVYLVNRLPYPVDVHLAFSGQRIAIQDLASGERRDLSLVTRRLLPAPRPKGFVSEHNLPAQPGPVPDPSAPPTPVTGSLLDLTLPAYALRSFLVLPEGAEIVYAAAVAPEAERQALGERLRAAEKLVSGVTVGEAEKQQAQATLVLARRAWNQSEYSRAGYLLDSFPLARLPRRATP